MYVLSLIDHVIIFCFQIQYLIIFINFIVSPNETDWMISKVTEKECCQIKKVNYFQFFFQFNLIEIVIFY